MVLDWEGGITTDQAFVCASGTQDGGTLLVIASELPLSWAEM